MKCKRPGSKLTKRSLAPALTEHLPPSTTLPTGNDSGSGIVMIFPRARVYRVVNRSSDHRSIGQPFYGFSSRLGETGFSGDLVATRGVHDGGLKSVYFPSVLSLSRLPRIVVQLIMRNTILSAIIAPHTRPDPVSRGPVINSKITRILFSSSCGVVRDFLFHYSPRDSAAAADGNCHREPFHFSTAPRN